MPKLYELTNQLKFLETIPPDKEIDEAPIKELINGVKLEINDKVTNIAKYVLSLKSDTKALKEEEERLYAKRQAINNRIEWLKGYLFTEMRASMIMQVKSEIVTVSIRSNPPSVEVNDVFALPIEYQKTITEPDKKGILEYYKATGEIVAGANIVTDKESIVIR